MFYIVDLLITTLKNTMEDCEQLEAFLLQSGVNINLSEAWTIFKANHYKQLEEIQRLDLVFAWACALNQVDEVTAILKGNTKRLDVRCGGNNRLTPLLITAKQGHLDVVLALLQHGARVNETGIFDRTPLWHAAENGHLDVVKVLLQHDANVNIADKKGCTPLFKAAENGHLDVVKELLEHDANVNIADKEGYTPLLNAAWHGHLDVVKELLQHGARVNETGIFDRTPLWYASFSGHLDVVKELLQHDADVNKADIEGKTPLYAAAQNGHLDAVKELLQHGAEVNQATNDGETPLWMPVWRGHLDVVKELLQHGADVNKADNDDTTPLWAAVETYRCCDMRRAALIALLLDNGAVVTNRIASDGRLRTVFMQGLQKNTTRTSLGDPVTIALFTSDDQHSMQRFFKRNQQIISYHEEVLSLIKEITEMSREDGNLFIPQISFLLDKIHHLSTDATQLDDIKIKRIDMYLALGDAERARKQLEDLPREVLDNQRRGEKLSLIEALEQKALPEKAEPPPASSALSTFFQPSSSNTEQKKQPSDAASYDGPSPGCKK